MKETSEKRSYGAAVNATSGNSPFTRTSIEAESTYLQAAYDIGGMTLGIANVILQTLRIMRVIVRL